MLSLNGLPKKHNKTNETYRINAISIITEKLQKHRKLEN